MAIINTSTKQELLRENEQLKIKLQEAEDTLDAIRSGGVDALVTSGPKGDQVFTLLGADHAYRVLVETMNEGATTLTPDGLVIYCNHRFSEMISVPSEKIIGNSISNFVHQDGASPLISILDHENGNAKRIEGNLKKSDGTRLPVLISSNYPKEDINCICVVFTELTEIIETRQQLNVAYNELEQIIQDRTDELVATNDALIDSEDRYRVIVETANEGIWTFDKDGITTYVNRKMSEMLDYNPDEMIGKGVDAFTDDYGRSLIKPNLQKRREGVPETFEFKLIRKDGTDLWAIVSAMPHFDKYGNYTGSLSLLTDITKRKKAEVELQKSETNLRAILDATQESIYMFDRDQHYLTVNKTASDRIGLPVEEMIGKRVSDFLSPSLTKSRWEVIQQVFDTGTPQRFEDIRNGMDFEHYMYPVFEGDKVTRVVSYSRDITERKKNEETFKILAKFPSENPNPIFRIDLSGKILYANAASEPILKLWKISINDILPKTHRDTVLEVFSTGTLNSLEIDCYDQTYSFQVVPILEENYINMYGRDITERKKAENQLKQKMDELQIILDSVPALIFYKDLDNHFIRTNKDYEETMKLSKEELEGKSLFDLYSKDLAQAYWNDDKEVFNSRIAKRGIIENIETNTGIRIVQTDKIPYFDQDGNVTGLIGFSLDITERVHAEEELQKNRMLLQSIMDNTQDPIYIKDINSRILLGNPALEKVVGKPISELLGKTDNEFYDDDEIGNAIRENDLRIINSGKSELVEETVLTPNGNRVFLSSKTPYRDSTGEIIGVIGISRDITERKQAEEALLTSEARFRTMANAIPQLAWMANPDGYIYWYNQRWYEYTGTKPEQMEGWGWQSVHDPEWLPGVMKRWQESLSTGNPFDMEFPLLGADGIFRMFLTRVMPLKDDNGKVLQWFGTNTDVSEAKKKEEDLRRLNRTLKALSDSNQAIMRATNEEKFLQEACKIIIDDCGHKMAWVGFAEYDEYKSIKPVASAGYEKGYLGTLKLSWEDNERGRGPTGTAIRTGKLCSCKDMQKDPKFEPWRKEAIKRGYSSSLVLPLFNGDTAYGAITIYSEEPDPFTEKETALLSELAGDISYGLMNLRLRVAHTKAEEALKRSEDRYRSLFEQMTEGFALHEIICDENSKPVDYRFLDLNPAFERLTGLIKNDIIRRTHNEVLPDEPPYWIEVYGKVALTGEPAYFDNFSPTLGRHFEVLAYRPALGQFAVIFTDITERKLMEDELQKSHDELEMRVIERTEELNNTLLALERERQRFNDVLNRLPAYVILLTEDYHVAFANKYFEDNFGKSNGRKCYEYLFNRTEPCEICETFKVLKTNEPLQWDWVGPNGRNYDIYDFPFTDRDGSEMILEMGIDITEKKLSQDVLKKQAAIMDLAHDAIFVKDLDNKIQFWNNGATDLYGYDANEAIGKITHELLKTKFPEQLEKIKDILYNKGSWEGELIHKSIDGLIIYVASRWSLLRDEHGKPEVILEINRDITEKRIADENSRVLADQYRAILATTTDGFWLCDIDGSIIDVNDTYCKISEYTNEELTGMKIWQLETMKNDSDSLQHINKVMKVGYDIFETQHRKKNGVIFDVEVAASFWESRELIIVFVRDISDRKKSEKALLRASIYSRTLIEASIDPLVTISSDGKITDVNNATEAVTGYPRAELIGTDFSDYFTEPDKARDVYKLVFQKGTVKDYELVIRHRFGHIFPVLYNATVYRDESGEVSGVFASARDMTELKRKEFALRESERNMMEAQRIAHLGSWQADFNSDDSKWYNVKWSDELYRILGYEPGEVRSSFELLIERINPEYRHLLGNFDNDTEGRRLENNIDYKITRIDGVERELFAKTEFIYDDSGRLIRAVGTVHDITDRKQIERELKKSYQYTRSLLEASLDPLVTINSEGKINDVNKAATKITGIDRDQMIGTDFSDYFTEPEKAREGYKKVFSEGFVTDFPLTIRHITGNQTNVLYNSSVYKDEADQVQGVFAAARDITQIKKAEVRLNNILNDLKRSNEELEQFAYVASHDLQEPLRMISSFTQLLARKYKEKLDIEAAEFIKFAVDGATRMQTLINDLLEFSRVSTRGKPFEPVDTSSVLGRVRSVLSHRLQETHAIIINDDLPVVMADSVQLDRLFQNLIDNSIKFRSDKTPYIHISVRELENEWEFSIKDNGIGMSQEYHDRVFVIFQRLHDREDYPGTGIGLSICKRIVERHSGRIWFESRLGEGTNFHFTLKKHQDINL